MWQIFFIILDPEFSQGPIGFTMARIVFSCFNLFGQFSRFPIVFLKKKKQKNEHE